MKPFARISCAILLIALLSGCGGGGPSISEYAGHYTGTWQGRIDNPEDFGDADITIDSQGHFQGTLDSPDLGHGTVTGTIRKSHDPRVRDSCEMQLTLSGYTHSLTGDALLQSDDLALGVGSMTASLGIHLTRQPQ